VRQAAFVVLAVILAALQVSYLPGLRPLGVVPDVVLPLVALTGLMSTVSRALAVAICGGLLLDMASGSDFGLRTGILILVALATGLIHRAGLNSLGPMVALVLVAAGTVVGNIILLASLAGGAASWPVGRLLMTIGLLVVLNLVITLLLRPLVKWLSPEESAWPVIV
jgi:rod shape-determining protein MreD